MHLVCLGKPKSDELYQSMRTPLPLLALAFAATIGGSVAALASTDAFLKIETIKGESMDIRHRGEIEILSWSWGASNPTSLGTGGLSADKVSYSDLSITKYPDRSSPGLLQALATGQTITHLEMFVRAKGGIPTEFHRFFGDGGMVTGYSLDTDTENNRPRETITLRFALVGVRNIQILPDGTQTALPDFQWDVTQNRIWDIAFPPFVPITDTDGDGIPDAWAFQNGFDPLTPHRDQDSDGDGATDYEEFVAGTNPNSRNSVLKSDITFPEGGRSAALTFPTGPGKHYRILVADTPDQPFVLFSDIPESSEGSTTVTLPFELTHQFFRIQVVP